MVQRNAYDSVACCFEDGRREHEQENFHAPCSQVLKQVANLRVVGEESRLHSSYERGCQEKKLLPAPLGDAGVVTYIQPHLIPHLILRGGIGLVVLAGRTFSRRCQPQWLVPTQPFHVTVALDALRLRSYASPALA